MESLGRSASTLTTDFKSRRRVRSRLDLLSLFCSNFPSNCFWDLLQLEKKLGKILYSRSTV